jgi:NADH:ubiquinone oxidoreductase subunit E
MNYEEIASKAKNEWDGMTNGKVPLIRIGTAMCGHAAGAFRVLDTLKKHINEKGIEANIQEVGCLGLCYAEPLLDIKKAGKSRLFFNNVAPEDIEYIR